MDSSMNDLKTLMNQLFESEKYSDLKIHCRGVVFPVHRFIVCTQSQVLEQEIKAVTHKHSLKHGAVYKIDLNEEQPASVAALLKYLYTREYDDHGQMAEEEDSWSDTAQSLVSSVCDSDTPAPTHELHSASTIESTPNFDQQDSRPKEEIHPIVFNTLVHTMAKKYAIEGLQELSAEKYRTAVAEEWDIDNFTKSLGVFFEEFGEHDWERPSKDIAMNAARIHIDDLLEDPQFELLLRRNGDIAFWILRTVAVGNKEVPATQSANEQLVNDADLVSISESPPEPLEEIPEAVASEEPSIDEKFIVEVAALEELGLQPAPQPSPEDIDLFWGTSKSKKKKKKAACDAAPADPMLEENVDFPWGISKKKKAIRDAAPESSLEDPVPEDSGTFWSASKKKKDTRRAISEMSENEEHAVNTVSDPPPAVEIEDDGWGFTPRPKVPKKDKKKSKTWSDEVPAPAPEPTSVEDDFGWGALKKDKKKGKKGVIEEPAKCEVPTLELEPAPVAEEKSDDIFA